MQVDKTEVIKHTNYQASPRNKQVQEIKSLTVIEVSFSKGILFTYFVSVRHWNIINKSRIKRDIKVNQSLSARMKKQFKAAEESS